MQTIFYDYDDTLGGVKFPDGSVRPGADAYFDVIDRYVAAMADLGFDPARAKVLQHEIDLVLATTHGFHDKTRFGQSMSDAYYAYCTEIGRQPHYREAERMFDTGMTVFTDYPYVALPGALDVLAQTAEDYTLVIVTKGEREEQWRKLRDSGVREFVAEDNIYVVGKKDDADWAFVLGDAANHYPGLSWAVGNSAKADVNPLLARGYNGIHIAEKNGWAFEKADLTSPQPGRQAHVVTDIAAVLPILGYVIA